MKLVVLDRDGVVNFDSVNFIKNTNEWIPIPGSLEAIALLNQSGYRVVIATNQSGISRGLFDMVTLNAIHDKMHKALGQLGGRVDAIFYCPHSADDNCSCRKPKPGMMEEIGHRFGMDMKACLWWEMPCATCRLALRLVCSQFSFGLAKAKKP